MEEDNITLIHYACDGCVKREPECKEEVDNTPITCVLSVKSEPHTDIDHPHTSSDNSEPLHRATSDIPESMQSGVDMSVQGAEDIKEVSCCIPKITDKVVSQTNLSRNNGC
jgi:hypothetical protein